MKTETVESAKPAKAKNGAKMPEKANGLKVQLPVQNYREVEIPGFKARLGVCFVKVVDLPTELETYMRVNPRVPSRAKSGVLAGPVVRGIMNTLRDNPEEMVLKNQGIYMLTDKATFTYEGEKESKLTLKFSDKGKHGIINGGHTYAAIMEALDTAEAEEKEALKQAYVRLHIYQGIDEDQVPEMAEGLNRSRQVDDPSLANLQGQFDIIRKALRSTPGEKAISYHQGDDGEVYISELLVYLQLFNTHRYTERRHPNGLYNRSSLGIKYFVEDLDTDRSYLSGLIKLLPDIVWLADSIRKATPAAARANRFKYGMVKMSGGERAGGEKAKGTSLPFLGESINYRVPNGWVYPMLAAFRANLKPDGSGWLVNPETLLAKVIDDLVGVCIGEHKDNNSRPEIVGKRETAYAHCYTKVQLYLAKKGHLL